jgi:hypothetical protein
MKISLGPVVMRPPASPSILPVVPGRVAISKLDPHCTSFINAVMLRTMTIRMTIKGVNDMTTNLFEDGLGR